MASISLPRTLISNHADTMLPARLDAGSMLAVTAVIAASHFIYHDYLSFKALGPGGTPSNFLGYCRVSLLSLFALRNSYAPPQTPLSQEQGFLSSLPMREGVRPRTKGIAPHRQTDQKISPKLFALLAATITAVSEVNETIEEGTSCFEKHGSGLLSKNPQRHTCGGEICHAHPSDGSMHLTLHPADVKTLLEAGWGERHPLSGGGWLEHFVPEGFVMVYSPRNEEDIDVVLSIIRAAAWWVGGDTIDLPEGRRGIEAYHNAKRSPFGITANQATRPSLSHEVLSVVLSESGLDNSLCD